MAMSAVYTYFGGRIVHEKRGADSYRHCSDPLGSSVAVIDTSDGSTVYEAEYWPYGEVQAETGTNPSSLGFVGLLGYFRDLSSLLYVRARHYLADQASWITVDFEWPDEYAYIYADSIPVVLVDPEGFGPRKPGNQKRKKPVHGGPKATQPKMTKPKAKPKPKPPVTKPQTQPPRHTKPRLPKKARGPIGAIANCIAQAVVRLGSPTSEYDTCVECCAGIAAVGGGAIGSFILPPWGTIVGGALAGAVGEVKACPNLCDCIIDGINCTPYGSSGWPQGRRLRPGELPEDTCLGEGFRRPGDSAAVFK